MDSYGRLDALCRRQHGLVTRDQLGELGCSPKVVARLTGAGRLIRVRRGVFRLCGAVPTWRSSALAAVLSAGGDAVLSHMSAAALWGLVDYSSLDRIELTASRQSRQDGLYVYRRRLDRAERTLHERIPVTTVERTLIDVGETVGAAEAGSLMDEAIRRRLTTAARIGRVFCGPATGRGRQKRADARAALARRGVGYDPGANDWEQEMDRRWDEMGLPPAVRQHRVRVAGRSYRIDRAIVDLKVAVEWNGFMPHGLRSNFDRDAERRARLTAAGWCVLEFTSNTPPQLMADTVVAVCEERRRLLE